MTHEHRRAWSVAAALAAPCIAFSQAPAAPGAPAECDKVEQAVARAPERAARVAPDAGALQAACRREVVHAESLLAVLRMLLASEAPGTKRLDKPMPLGMPTGLLLAQQGVLTLDLGPAASEGLLSMIVEGPGMPRTVIAPVPPSGRIDLPAAAFRPAHDYRWTLKTRATSYRGEFSVADDATRAAVAAALAEVAALPVSARTRTLLEAAVYDDAELESARDRLVREMRERAGP